jgi:hypothetical protein
MIGHFKRLSPIQRFKRSAGPLIVIVAIGMLTAVCRAQFSDPSHLTDDEQQRVEDRAATRCVVDRVNEMTRAFESHGSLKNSKKIVADCARFGD